MKIHIQLRDIILIDIYVDFLNGQAIEQNLKDYNFSALIPN